MIGPRFESFCDEWVHYLSGRCRHMLVWILMTRLCIYDNWGIVLGRLIFSDSFQYIF